MLTNALVKISDHKREREPLPSKSGAKSNTLPLFLICEHAGRDFLVLELAQQIDNEQASPNPI